mmetsp:Transcript_24716/g.70888  ORF Transcript_24716/g.70888 Transcript_24716/m.70888 type:complete len:330 (+) Transcript_24716:114-1103(+)
MAVVEARASEGLAAKLRQKTQEARALREKLLRSRLQTQHLRARLLSVGVADAGLVPKNMVAGSGGASETANLELKSLLEWLAQTADFTQQAQFECGGGGVCVAVGARRVAFRGMCAMPLRSGAGEPSKLQLSVPAEMRSELAVLLGAVRRRGGSASAMEVTRVAESWELVAAEMASAAGQLEPAIFLVRRPSDGESDAAPAQAMVVAQWPSIDFAGMAAANTFSPAQHFQRLAASAAGGAQERPTPPPKQMRMVVRMSTEQPATVKRYQPPQTVNERDHAESTSKSVALPATALPSARTVPPGTDDSQAEAKEMTSRRAFRHVRARTGD